MTIVADVNGDHAIIRSLGDSASEGSLGDGGSVLSSRDLRAARAGKRDDGAVESNDGIIGNIPSWAGDVASDSTYWVPVVTTSPAATVDSSSPLRRSAPAAIPSAVIPWSAVVIVARAVIIVVTRTMVVVVIAGPVIVVARPVIVVSGPVVVVARSVATVVVVVSGSVAAVVTSPIVRRTVWGIVLTRTRVLVLWRVILPRSRRLTLAWTRALVVLTWALTLVRQLRG